MTEMKLTSFKKKPATADMPMHDVEYAYAQKPSWKVYGNGTATVRLQTFKGRDIEVIAREYCRDTNREKEVFFTIPRNILENLLKETA